MEKLINSALRKRMLAEREAKAEARINAKVNRILDLLLVHCAIFTAITAVLCIFLQWRML